jgi:hypothetical protein
MAMQNQMMTSAIQNPQPQEGMMEGEQNQLPQQEVAA